MPKAVSVAVESPLLQLDRDFHFLLPKDTELSFGQRVRFPFGRSKKELTGFVLEEIPESEFAASPISAVVDERPVLRRDVYQFCRAVADRQVVALGELLAQAIPDHMPRVKFEIPEVLSLPAEPIDVTREVMLDTARQTEIDGAFYPRWCELFLSRANQMLQKNRSTIIVLPESDDVEMLNKAAKAMGIDVELMLPGCKRSERFKTFHALLDRVKIVIGTRSAIYAPVAQLGLVAVADDLDDSLREVGSPHTQIRDLALMRAGDKASVLFASPYRSLELQRLVEIGYLKEIEAEDRPLRISFTEPGLRIDEASFKLVRDSLKQGPRLVLLPRKGMASAAWCASCGERQRCACGGFIWEPKAGVFACRLCGKIHLSCQSCSHRSFRPGRKASGRTVAELGKAFPNSVVMEATAEHKPSGVGKANQIVIATPGSAPRTPKGYSALLILDPDVWLSAQSLQAEQFALRDWTEAMQLLNPSARVVISGLGSHLGQPLSLWQHRELASAALGEAKQLGLPPANRCVTLTGQAATLQKVASVLGSMGCQRLSQSDTSATFTFTYRQGPEVARELRALALATSARETSSGKQRGLKIAMDDLGVL